MILERSESEAQCGHGDSFFYHRVNNTNLASIERYSIDTGMGYCIG